MKNNGTLNRFLQFFRQYVEGDAQYWYPLCHLKKEVPVAAFDLDEIYKHNAMAQMESVLRNHGIHMVKMFQIQDHGVEAEEVDLIKLLYEKDSKGYNFPWCVETFYYDQSKKWMIYVSHEGTVTFTGMELVDEAKRIISNQYIYGLGSLPEL